VHDAGRNISPQKEHYNAQVVYLRKKNPDLMILAGED